MDLHVDALKSQISQARLNEEAQEETTKSFFIVFRTKTNIGRFLNKTKFTR